jgi:hypothetical protein
LVRDAQTSAIADNITSLIEGVQMGAPADLVKGNGIERAVPLGAMAIGRNNARNKSI